MEDSSRTLEILQKQAEQVIKPIKVENMIGHPIGIFASYYRPLGREVLEDYLKAVQSIQIYMNICA